MHALHIAKLNYGLPCLHLCKQCGGGGEVVVGVFKQFAEWVGGWGSCCRGYLNNLLCGNGGRKVIVGVFKQCAVWGEGRKVIVYMYASCTQANAPCTVIPEIFVKIFLWLAQPKIIYHTKYFFQQINVCIYVKQNGHTNS